ncbi:hypothetical protein [Erysipelothrix rhusiopathiae]|uniref:hypothetical protein n=1 Tax=Erysipelothrix rhusiopathiae TaxID=1648 RepID=UPI0039E88C5C
MEILNFLNDSDRYQMGLIASHVSDLIHAPSFVDFMILDNDATLSDAHTWYYVDLITVVNPEVEVAVMISDFEHRDKLMMLLTKKDIDVITINNEYVEDYQPTIIPKWRIIKKRKLAKKNQEQFYALRTMTEIPTKQGLISKWKAKKNESDFE